MAPPPDALDPSPSVLAAYDVTAFRREAAELIERVAAHLERAMSGAWPVAPAHAEPDAMLARWNDTFPEAPASGFEALVQRLLDGSIAQHSPQFTGHQVSAPLPRAALAHLVAAVLNSGMAIYDSGPVATVMERRVIAWMLAHVGFERGGGVLTSGGSLGNLTALLAARQARSGTDVLQHGLREPLAILCSEQVHYCTERAAEIMGLGREGVFRIATDVNYRLDPAGIRPAFEAARAAGRRPFALVVSAGATGTGSIDPLHAAADAAQALGLWLHVDGAHGASALVSRMHRSALDGIARADSVAWDAHKLLAMPALCTGVLFRDARAPYATFAQDAAYLFEEQGDEPWFDIGRRTVECTKALLPVPLYLCLATHGTRVLEDMIDHAYALARHFHALLEAAPDFECAHAPDSNILCFRHLADVPELDAHQRGIRARLRAEGDVLPVMTTLRGRTYLRVSLMNPLTTPAHLARLVDAIRDASRAVRGA